MRKLGVGVLGVGEMGKRHAENLRRVVPEARLVAIADASAERARQTAAELEIENWYPSLDGLLERKDLDALLIATPDKFHAQAVIAAVGAGKDVLCEKPLALSLADARAALEAVSKSGRRLQVGFMRRYDPAYAAAMKRIEAGEIGVPVVFKSVGRDQFGPPLAAYQANLNGMLFYASTVHDFDLARWMMQDEVTHVSTFATTAIRPEVAQFGDIVAGVVNLQFRQGAIGSVESYAQAVYGYDVRTEIVGSQGSILIGTVRHTPAVFLTARGGEGNLADHFLTRFADAYLLEVRDFVHNILRDRPLRVTGDDGLKSLAIAVAAEQSYLQAKPIEVALADARAASCDGRSQA
jgi:scyllo-inositol 2-dehydrogenase (NAD+)